VLAAETPNLPVVEDLAAPYREGLHTAVRMAQDLEQQIYAEAARHLDGSSEERLSRGGSNVATMVRMRGLEPPPDFSDTDLNRAMGLMMRPLAFGSSVLSGPTAASDVSGAASVAKLLPRSLSSCAAGGDPVEDVECRLSDPWEASVEASASARFWCGACLVLVACGP
jgi:hypothetical protein